MTAASCLYVGGVMHRRLKPRPHALEYRCFWMLLDLDELASLGSALWLFAYNRAAPASFHDRDHGPGRAEPLRGYVERHLAGAGIDIAGGPIRLLCMPRIAGYGFNPISIYFCHQRDGALAALIYEVTNTWRERHSYLIPVGAAADGAVRQHCAKRLYVSPFMDDEIAYDFRVTPPGDDLSVVIRASDRHGPVLVASLKGERRPLSDASLLGVLASQPLLPLKVMTAIHAEAVRLWLKRIGVRPKPAPPAAAVSITLDETPR